MNPQVQHRPAERGERGFTLIELMIALLVLGVLVAVGLPSLMDSIRKGRRSDAIAALSVVQLAQERWRANNTSYAALLTAAPTADPPGLGLPANTNDGYYTIALSGVSATGYTVTATAASGRSQTKDGDCAKLSVRMAGGNLFYGSASLSGTIVESANNRCWSR